jgi:hypothetical protein
MEHRDLLSGILEAMWSGEVAKEHHDLWLEEQLATCRSTPEAPTAAE